MREVFSQMSDKIFIEGVAVVRAVQNALHAIQLYPDARAGERLDVGMEVPQ